MPTSTAVNTLRPGQDGRHFADDTFKRIFVNENVRILIEVSLKFVPKGPINNIPALVQIMAWRRPGDKPLSEPMMVSLLTHICVTRPQWVKLNCLVHFQLPFEVWSWMSNYIPHKNTHVITNPCPNQNESFNKGDSSSTYLFLHKKFPVVSFTKELNPPLAERPLKKLKTNGCLANGGLTSLVKEATASCLSHNTDLMIKPQE